MRIARLQHSVLQAVAAGDKIDLASLVAFNAGVDAILVGNRDAMDSEMLALENLLDTVFGSSGGEASASPSPEASSPPGDGTVSDGGPQPSTLSDAAAGGAESPQDGSVTAVAAPEAGVVPAPVDLSQPDVQHLDAQADPNAVNEPAADPGSELFHEDDGA